ncbi:MAG: hypothetical protein LBE03_02810 [Candidatus Nomurabacteria bacterium]|jgi:hypothetical protein|nr:hypothetical protein [Candidatus Nomurabacteria bacterium]
MTIASVASYLNPDGKPIIPLACTTQTDKPQIVISQMFYDIDATKSIIDQYSNKNDEVMIILEADYLLTQTSPSTHCTIDAFIRTFGNPLRAEQSAFNNKLLFYDEKQFNDTILGLPVMEQF